MIEEMLLLIVLLQIKHVLFDYFENKTFEIADKISYGNVELIWHSVKHGLGTVICLLIISDISYIIYALILGFLNFVLNYNINFLRIKYGQTRYSDEKFLKHFGISQLFHQITYLFIAYLMF